MRNIIKTTFALFLFVCIMAGIFLFIGGIIAIMIKLNVDGYIQFIKDFTINSWGIYAGALMFCFLISTILEFVEIK